MFYHFTLLTLFLFLTPASHAWNQCRDLFAQLVLLENEKVYTSLPNQFLYKDFARGFYFEAILYKDGFIFIDAFLRRTNGTRSSQRGTDLYKLMIQHFGEKNIRGIESSWFEGDNLEEYYSNLANGMTREEAARHTWSGRQAAKYGFTYVRSIETIRDDLDHEFSPEIGVSHNRWSRAIKVVFTHPPDNE